MRQESLRVLLALSVQYELKLQQLDVVTVFLHEEEVYMAQPLGFVSPGQEHLVCKRIYGLKQFPRCWNSMHI